MKIQNYKSKMTEEDELLRRALLHRQAAMLLRLDADRHEWEAKALEREVRMRRSKNVK